jgi:MFS family permease
MHPQRRLFVGNLFYSVGVALAFYVLLPYLTIFMTESRAGLIVALGGLGAFLLFFVLPGLFARFGAQWLTLVFATIELILLAWLASAPDRTTGIVLAILIVICTPFIAYGLDLLFEAAMPDGQKVGRLRALFLTAWNLGFLAAPLSLGLILDGTDNYARVFLAGAIALFPLAVLLSGRRLPKGETPRLVHVRDSLVAIERDRDLLAVTFAHLLLWLFYVWAPLYVPLYLHTALGFSWATLGWMFFVMLLPYVLVEYPAAWIADNVLGDKELMMVGFLIAGISLASLAFLGPHPAIFLVLLILIASRIGTALVESTTEAHFFRRVSRKDISSISIFRGVWPMAYVIAPVTASFILASSSYPMFFLVTGSTIAIAGGLAAGAIKDFK